MSEKTISEELVVIHNAIHEFYSAVFEVLEPTAKQLSIIIDDIIDGAYEDYERTLPWWRRLIYSGLSKEEKRDALVAGWFYDKVDEE